MLKAPKYETDIDNGKVWLRLPLGGNGEVNHFLDALMMRSQMERDADLMVFCGKLKAHERFYKNDLVTDFDIDDLEQFLRLLTEFVNLNDPYKAASTGKATPRSRQGSNNNIVDADIVSEDDDHKEGADL